MRDDIQHILSGKSQVKYHHLIQTTCSYLKRSQGTSSMVKDQQQHKEEETKRLVQFIEENDLWVDNINIDFYLSQGAEQIKIPFQLYRSLEVLFFYFVLTC